MGGRKLDEFEASQAQRATGQVVAAVSNRDILIFTGNKSREGPTKICKLIAREGLHPISRTLRIRRGGTWKVPGACDERRGAP